MNKTHPDLPPIAFPDQAAMEAWLANQPADAKGAWIKFAKTGSQIASVSKAQAIEAALCWGWIDGQIGALDDNWFMTRFTPRRPRSKWSRINRDNAARLIEAGRMQPAGLAQVETAKADGRWDLAYEPQSKAEVPADLEAVLDAHPKAKAQFANLDSANRYAVLYRVHQAKPPARAKKIADLVAMLARGETIHPPRGKSKT